MTIIAKPDEISLSGNLKNFRIGSFYPVQFSLYKEDVLIFSSTYTPGYSNEVHINVKDIVTDSLYFELKETTAFYPQNKIKAQFKAVLNQTNEIFFSVIRAGVLNFSDTAANFLKSNFLTWQPQIKEVTFNSPEYLTYYAESRVNVKCRIYYNGEDSVLEHNLTLATLPVADKVYTIPVHYSVINNLVDNITPGAYDIWVENLEGERLTYIQRYIFSDILSEQEDWILFENSLGGIDTFRAYGATEFTSDNTHNLSVNNEVLSEYRVDTERKYDKSTGYIDTLQRKWLLDFFPSKTKYIYDAGAVRKIVVVESNVSYQDKNLPSEFTFVYRFADDKPFLNISRSDTLPDELSFVVPDLASFPLPPRLNEFPRQALSEGVLFPVQHPYAEKWGTTTFGAILQNIVSSIEEVASSDGSAAFHIHENQDLLVALSWLNKYLLVGGQKINAGSADILADDSISWDKIVTKDVDSIVTAVITFLNKLIFSGDLISADYAQGLLGWKINKDGATQLKNLRILEFLEAPEFRYNRVTVLSGESWRGPGAGLIESVDLENQIVYLKLIDGDVRTVEVDDICKGIFYHSTGFSNVFFRITELIGDTAFKYSLRPSTSFHPAAVMNFIAYGNFTNQERQRSVQETTSYKRYLANVNTWEISPDMIMLQLGDLSGLQINGTQMGGYSAYLRNIYMTGTIKQLSSSGTEVNVAIIMGEWKPGTYGYYEQVTHLGSSWLCVNEHGSSIEPAKDSVDWLEISAKGKDAFVCEITSSNGNIFRNGFVATTLTCNVRQGDIDITDSIPPNRFSWLKTSLNTDTDLIFNNQHNGHGNILNLTSEDISGRATFECIVTI